MWRWGLVIRTSGMCVRSRHLERTLGANTTNLCPQLHLPPPSDKANLRCSSVCSIPCIRRPNQRQGPFELRISLPSISYIVARSRPGSIIGRKNELPWHLRTDLQRFKSYTSGHAIIMGRKTYLSIGRPLPSRVNIVLSRRSEFDAANSFWHRGDTMLVWVENLESALFFADVMSIAKERSDFFVIGGAEMYRIFGGFFNKVYLTEVLTRGALRREPDDAVFEYKFDGRKWKTIESITVPAGLSDDFPSKFSILERKAKRVRYLDVEDFYTEAESKKKWVEEQLDRIERLRTKRAIPPLVRIPEQYDLFAAAARSD
jgi:dihydrofolate reductase